MQLRSQDDGGKKGEKRHSGVQGELDNGAVESFDKDRGDPIDARNPGQDGDKHGKVDGGRGRAGGVDIGGDDVANECSNEQRAEQRYGAQGDVCGSRHCVVAEKKACSSQARKEG